MTTIDAHFRGRRGDFALDAAFSCPARGVTGLFGPSGCGKTTVLRCVAGLTRLDGHLSVAGAVWQDGSRFLPAHRRAIGYVFQESRLFPHLSVRGNLAFGLRRAPPKSVAGAPAAIDIDSVLDLMGIRPLIERTPATLSAGERQRVAIARAVLAQPQLLLMDEPLSALDRLSKDDILPILEQVTTGLAIPVLYVTHDIAEIERLADHCVLMAGDGRVQASGPLATLLTDLTLPLAHMPDSAVVLAVTVVDYDAAYDLTTATVAGLALRMPGKLGEAGSTRRVRVRATDVSLSRRAPEGSSVLNVLPVRIVLAEAGAANEMLLLLALGDGAGEAALLSCITRRSWDDLGLHPGAAVYAQVKGMALPDRR